MKKNSNLELALQLFLKNLVSKLFCFLLFFTFFMAVRGKAGTVITQVFDLVILTVIIFSASFDRGNKDRNRVVTGAVTEDINRGFKAGFLAAVPDFLIIILLVLSKAEILPRVYTAVYGILNAPFYPFILTLMPQTLTGAEQSVLAVIASALTSLFMPLVAGFSYKLGYYDYSIIDKILYRTPEAQKKHKQNLIEKKAKRERRLW